jgi:hypothetical protein
VAGGRRRVVSSPAMTTSSGSLRRRGWKLPVALALIAAGASLGAAWISKSPAPAPAPSQSAAPTPLQQAAPGQSPGLHNQVTISPSTVVAPTIVVSTERAPARIPAPDRARPKKIDWRATFPETKRCRPDLRLRESGWWLVCVCPEGEIPRAVHVDQSSAQLSLQLWQRARRMANAEQLQCP